MSTFVAIDFETANRARSSACSLGIVRVEDGRIVDRDYFLIRPDPSVFEAQNVRIHGITKRDVARAPVFAEVWPQLEPLLQGQLVVAHNAGFDLSVLQQCLDRAGLAYPTLEHACTVQMARLVWRGRPSYRLQALATSIGHRFRHHHALADAEACARIALRAAEEAGTASLRALLAAHGRSPTSLHDGCEHPPLDPIPQPAGWQYRSRGARQGELKPRVSSFDPAHPFFEKRVVFTGELEGLERIDAMQLVVDRGGSYGNAVNKKTDVLVVADSEGGPANTSPSRKLRAARELIEQGQAVQILSEEEFRALTQERDRAVGGT